MPDESAEANMLRDEMRQVVRDLDIITARCASIIDHAERFIRGERQQPIRTPAPRRQMIQTPAEEPRTRFLSE